MDELPGFYTNSLPGLHFSPSLWTDNDQNIILTYNEKKHLTAYIEDYYQPTTPEGSNATESIQWKLQYYNKSHCQGDYSAPRQPLLDLGIK